MKKWTVRCTLIWSINTWHCGMHQKHWKEWKKERMVTWDNGGGQKGIKPNPAGKEYRETIRSMTELIKR